MDEHTRTTATRNAQHDRKSQIKSAFKNSRTHSPRDRRTRKGTSLHRGRQRRSAHAKANAPPKYMPAAHSKC